MRARGSPAGLARSVAGTGSGHALAASWVALAAFRCALAASCLVLAATALRAEEPEDRAFKDALSVATTIFQRLVEGDAGALRTALRVEPVRAETLARLAARGVPTQGDRAQAVLGDLFARAIHVVLDGVAADLKGVAFEFAGRPRPDGGVDFFAHGEAPPREFYIVCRLARTDGLWRVESFVQALLPLDLPELALGTMVGFASRDREAEPKDGGSRIEAAVGAAALLVALFWGARRISGPRALVYCAALLAWVGIVAGAWAAMVALEPPEKRVRAGLLALPEAPVFLAMREAKIEAALASLEGAIASRPGDRFLLSWKVFLAQAFARQGPAPELWQALLDHPPAQHAAHYALAHHAIKRGDFPEARKLLEPFAAFVGDDPYLGAKLLWMRARLGEMDPLELEFLVLLQRAHSPMPILLFRAKSFAALGLVNRAFADLEDLARRGQLYREMVVRDADFAKLREDPRWTAMVGALPTLEDRH